MEESNKDEEFVDSRVVKTVRSLRKNSAKKEPNSANNAPQAAANNVRRSNSKAGRMSKKKSQITSKRLPITVDELREMTDRNKSAADQNKSAHVKAESYSFQNTEGLKFNGKKEPVLTSQKSNNNIGNRPKGERNPRQGGKPKTGTGKNTASTTGLGNKVSTTNMQMTQDVRNTADSHSNNGGVKAKLSRSKINFENTEGASSQQNLFLTSDKSRQPTRGESEGTQNGEKAGGKRLPPGVRLYNQSKNKPKAKTGAKNKHDELIKPMLTKSVEVMLIQSNREKCEEIIKGSNAIHETLKGSKIDKNSMVDALFSDPLFNHALANLLFHSKILGNSKLEGFLYDRIKKFIKEYETDRKIKENLYDIHNKIKDKIAKLKETRQNYHKCFD